MQIAIYTDGGCSGNPGRGAWAFVIIDTSTDAILKSESGHELHTTNNRMELRAVIAALQSAHRAYSGIAFPLFTDSKYVQQGITVWIHTWMRNNWRSKSKQPVKNVDLWIELYGAQRDVAVEWRWMRGHAGGRYNEHCHQMVQQEIARIPPQSASTNSP